MNERNMLENLAAKGVLLLFGRITPEKHEVLARQLLGLECEERTDIVTLRIDSGGGDAFVGLRLSDAIRFAPFPVHGVVTGRACSAAFLVLQNCDRRIAWPNARLVFHPGTCTVQIDSEDGESTYRRGKELWERSLGELSQKSGKDIETLRRWGRDDREFSADEALKLGFIDEILQPPKKE